MWKRRRDFEAELVARVWQDKSLKKALLADPKAFVEKLSQEKLPKNLKVTVLEESPNQVYLVLPKDPDHAMSEAELSTVAGGVKDTEEGYRVQANHLFDRH